MRWVTKILLRKFILEKPENLLENSCKSPGILNLYLAGHPARIKFLVKRKQEKKQRRMTMKQGYHQAKLAVLILAIRMNLKN